MKKVPVILALSLFIGYVTGWVYYNNIKPKQIVKEYYTALMNENYEKSFTYLLIFDQYVDKGTKLSKSEALGKYLKK